MHAAIARAVRLELEADFPDRAVLLFERGHHILLAEAKRHQMEQRVFGQRRRPLSGIGDDEAARTAQGRLGMANKALVGIVAGRPARVIGYGFWGEEMLRSAPHPT